MATKEELAELRRIVGRQGEMIQRLSAGGGEVMSPLGHNYEPQLSPINGTPFPSAPPSPYTPQAVVLSDGWREWAKNPASLGLPDDHIVAKTFDVAFVVTTFVTCMFAVTALDPSTPESALAAGHPLSAAMLTWSLLDMLFLQAWVASRFAAQVRAGDWQVVDSLGAIRVRYLSWWFWFDQLFANPVFVLALAVSRQAYFFMLARHFLRICRTLSHRRRSNPLKARRSWFTFVWMNCFFAWVLHVFATGFADIEGRSYVDSLYFAVVTVSTVGYGDIAPSSTTGRIFTLVLMIGGVMLVAVVTAFATVFMTERDEVRRVRDARRRMTEALFAQYNVPWAVQRAVIAAYPEVEAAQLHGRDFAALMGNMPSDCRAAVGAYAHLQILSRALHCDGPAWTSPQARGALVSLAESLSVRWVAAGRDVVRAGDPSTTLYIVFHGTVARRTAADGPHGRRARAWFQLWPLGRDSGVCLRRARDGPSDHSDGSIDPLARRVHALRRGTPSLRGYDRDPGRVFVYYRTCQSRRRRRASRAALGERVPPGGALRLGGGITYTCLASWFGAWMPLMM
jgi:voltage-gated potassium channel Kch